MRRLAESSVLKSAGVAAVLTALACAPRFASAPIHFPVWYLEAVMLVGSFVLWAFVFAWHEPHTKRELFPRRLNLNLWGAATLAGVLVALLLHYFLDPNFKPRTPADYPNSMTEWPAMTAFAVAFHPLLLTFAPLAWAARLTHRVWIAAGFTVLFGVFVMAIKIQSAATPPPPTIIVELLILRLGLGSGSVYFHLRGGLRLAWWWTLLLQLRHLLGLQIGG